MSHGATATAEHGKAAGTADAGDIVAEHLARTRYEDLPPQVIAAAKASILDTISCIYAGTASADVARLKTLAESWGGAQQATVIGGGGLKLPAASAVLINGGAVHQDDFDDCSDYAPSHPTSASLTAGLATAELLGGKSGKDLILAVALGNDLICRLSKSIVGRIFDHPWFRAPVCGLFGATAAAASMRGADAEQHRQALGLTLPMVGGTWASLHEADSSIRSIRDGLAYRNGVLAAEMAMSGLRGDPDVFEGKYGFFTSYYNGEFRRDDVIGELGTFFETERVSLKPWPSMRNLHHMITAVIDVMEKHDLKFEDIAGVEMEVGSINLTRCKPVHKGAIPDRRIDLLSNLPFGIAATIRLRGIPLQLFHHGKMADDVIETALPKVSWVQSERQNTKSSFEVGRAKITTTAGVVHTAECHTARGNPQNPMTFEQRRQKFYDCNAQAANPVPTDRAEELIKTIEALEELGDVAQLARLLH